MAFPKPEIMSPAGHWPQMRAAMEAGADAVYFGLLKDFTARAKVGFSLEELPEAMRMLHQRGLRGYLTFNTLVFDRELERAAETLTAIAASGVDAIIVQDFGVVKLARRIAPDLEIHGSTQMTITSAEGARLIRSLGVTRVVLARELSLEEIRAIRAGTDCELEMFVHGALCVSYSGQCLSSEAWGGRSANRGQCAQACRLPYEMIVDGHVKPLDDARYLLSPEDLYALHQMPEIVRLGVSALKIEGRYKDADYVALATAAYRKAVDEAWAGLPLSVSEREELQLRQVYSRGFAPAFITGTNHQAVVKGRAPRHRGVLLGRVQSIAETGVVIVPNESNALAPLKPGDGVVFDAADWRSPQEPEEGGRLYEVRPRDNGKLELRFANRALDFTRIRPGDWLWRTSDPDIAKAARPYLEAVKPLRKQPVNVRVTAHEGQPLIAEWSLAEHPKVRADVISDSTLERAESTPMDRVQLQDQFGRLGNTAYELASLDVEIGGRPFAPASMLNQLRRRAVERLAEMQSQVTPCAVVDAPSVIAALQVHAQVGQAS
jgi:putative protease